MRPWKYLCLILVAALAGCAAIPTAGTVDSNARPVPVQGVGGASINVEPPPQGANPAQIVDGFLAAMASFAPGYETARMYLTSQAAQAWNPQSQVLIYTGGPRVTGTQVVISGSLVGSLDADASFTPSDAQQWTHDFGLVKENEEWRISSPPSGLALSEYKFSQSFTRVEAYFFSNASDVLVPDSRYMQRGSWDATAAVRMVLLGPSDWLSPVVDGGYRRDTVLSGEVTVTSDGVAQVPLAATARNVARVDLTRLAIELAATMRTIPSITRVQLVTEGGALPLEPLAGISGDHALPVSLAYAFDATRTTAVQQLFVVSQGVIAQMDGHQQVILQSDWGTSPREISSFSVSLDSEAIAAIVPDGIVSGLIADGAGEPVLSSSLISPQYGVGGALWVMSSHEGATQAWISTGGSVVSLDTDVLDGYDVQSFQVSPDGRRILIVGQSSEENVRPSLSIGLIDYTDGTPTGISSLRTIPIAFQGTAFSSIADVAWVGATSILLLGAAQSGSASEVFLTDTDGLATDAWGNPGQAPLIHMATHVTAETQQVSVLDDEGTVWNYQDSNNWVSITSGVSAIAYPS